MAKSKDNKDMRIAPPETLAQFGFDEKDYVVPQYSEEGRRLTHGRPVLQKPGQSKIAMAIAMHAQGHGGRMTSMAAITPVSSNPIRKQAAVAAAPVSEPQPQPQPQPQPASKAKGRAAGRKKAKVVAEVETPVEEYRTYETAPADGPAEMFTQGFSMKSTVVFNTPFGKIRSAVEEVMTTDLGVMLVYSGYKAITLLPDPGATLKLTIDNEDVKVLYTGCCFVGSDQRQYLMFIKDAN